MIVAATADKGCGLGYLQGMTRIPEPQLRRLLTGLLTCLALTFLNPHVYLDTVVLLGTLANQQGDRRWLFGGGAALASTVWFFGLGFGARRVAGLFATATTWRVLDAVIAVTMIALGVSLALT